MTKGTDINQDLDFGVTLNAPDTEALSEGFNRHGIKETEDRVEFIYEAMQPGLRNGFRITEDFLRDTAQEFNGNLPLMAFHNKRQLSLGNVTEMWFSDGALRLRGYVPKTGAQSHQEVVERMTYDPPQIQDGSVGFGQNYELTKNEAGEPELVGGVPMEFSLTHFPGGYDKDTGGLKAQFEQAFEEYQGGQDDDNPQSEEVGFESADSRLVTETIEF